MKVMITGHRPSRLGGYRPNPLTTKIKHWLGNTLKFAFNADENLEIISGMALGVDQWWAESGIRLGLPVHAYIPFKNQEKIWPLSSQQKYRNILSKVTTQKTISQNTNSGWGRAMQLRNKAMVDNADWCIAVWDGTPKGGTWNCIQYIRKKDKFLYLYNLKKDKCHWEKQGKLITNYKCKTRKNYE